MTDEYSIYRGYNYRFSEDDPTRERGEIYSDIPDA